MFQNIAPVVTSGDHLPTVDDVAAKVALWELKNVHSKLILNKDSILIEPRLADKSYLSSAAFLSDSKVWTLCWSSFFEASSTALGWHELCNSCSSSATWTYTNMIHYNNIIVHLNTTNIYTLRLDCVSSSRKKCVSLCASDIRVSRSLNCCMCLRCCSAWSSRVRRASRSAVSYCCCLASDCGEKKDKNNTLHKNVTLCNSYTIAIIYKEQ